MVTRKVNRERGGQDKEEEDYGGREERSRERDGGIHKEN